MGVTRVAGKIVPHQRPVNSPPERVGHGASSDVSYSYSSVSNDPSISKRYNNYYVYLISACLTDCLQCWRDVCSTDEVSFFENNFRDDCCNCVQGGECLLLTTSASLLNHSQCCISASNNITTLLLQNEPRDAVCSQSHPFTPPENLRPIDEVMTLQPKVYVVPTFQFQCQGCVDEIQVQGQVTDYTHDDPINITMNFMIWARFVDTEDDQDSLYQLRKNVTRTVTELDITPEEPRKDQLAINFSLTDSSELCFSENEVFGFSFEGTPALLVILDTNDDDDDVSTYSLSPSVDDTCPELMDYYTATLVQEDRVPLMAIRISEFLIHMCE